MDPRQDRRSRRARKRRAPRPVRRPMAAHDLADRRLARTPGIARPTAQPDPVGRPNVFGFRRGRHEQASSQSLPHPALSCRASALRRRSERPPNQGGTSACPESRRPGMNPLPVGARPLSDSLGHPRAGPRRRRRRPPSFATARRLKQSRRRGYRSAREKRQSGRDCRSGGWSQGVGAPPDRPVGLVGCRPSERWW